MNFSDEYATLVLKDIEKTLNDKESDRQKVRRIWHMILGSHAQFLALVLPHLVGRVVQTGPFKGMTLTDDVLEGVSAPALLGCYEHELHLSIEKALHEPFHHILNIGCSYGYYCVGFARRMPSAFVHAFDIDPQARRKCKDMAAANQVSNRLSIDSEFKGEDFERYKDEPTLVLMDIEGAEKDLLDPSRYPALKKMSIIVELHDCYDPNISRIIQDRFTVSHNVEIIRNRAAIPDFDLQSLMKGAYVDPFDKFLCGWENRGGPTPWGVMWPK